MNNSFVDQLARNITPLGTPQVDVAPTGAE